MLYASIFIQCAVFTASYVYCVVRPAPDGFFRAYNGEQNCARLDYVTSHSDYQDRSALSLDLVCQIHGWYDLISFALPQPTVIRTSLKTIRIVKLVDDLTLISFRRGRKDGLASLFFLSVEDAKNFRRAVYGSMKDVLKHLQKTGRIDKILATQPNKYPVAAQYADIYYDDKNDQMNFIIEADGNPEPVLAFMHEEFQIIDIDGTKNVGKTQLRIRGGTAYDIYFDNDKQEETFSKKIKIYAQKQDCGPSNQRT